MITQPSPAWAHLPPPVPEDFRSAWSWTITRPAELTAARNQLRARSMPEAMPTGADEDDLDRLLLAFEEIASNGLRHGGAPVQVTVHSCDVGWLIDVSDSLPDQPPTPAVNRDPAFGGLGLHLIARLSTAFGWAAVGARKHVWAALLPA
jgi:anti-sigma regulatory factor (Ser/Thr protein kinase)